MGRRALTVRVVEAAAAYRRGLEGAFTAAGHRLARGQEKAAVLLVAHRGREDCSQLERLSRQGRVVALVDPGDVTATAHALWHGAVAAVDWRADPERIVEVAEAASRGDTLLPMAVARSLAVGGADPHAERPEMDEEEVEWLEALAAGGTVVGLAEDYGYSERAMFRRLRDLYARLGASNRAEALIAATRLGILEEP
jgi:DNA-binding NarL/FixJ family response regulator